MQDWIFRLGLSWISNLKRTLPCNCSSSMNHLSPAGGFPPRDSHRSRTTLPAVTCRFFCNENIKLVYLLRHGLRTPREEIAFTAQPKIHSHSQIFRYGQSICCLPHRPNFSDIFDICLHWVSVVCAYMFFLT